MNPIGERIACFVAGLVVGALGIWLLPHFVSRTRRTAAPVIDPLLESVTAPPGNAAASQHASMDEQDVIPSSRVIDVRAAREAGFNLKHADDLTVIEGIGPRIEDLLRANGIDSFAKIATLGVDDLRDILDGAGASFRFAEPSGWPQEAALASRNCWAELKRRHDERLGADATGSPRTPPGNA
jgi:predicted flap endonuclease-1-like 5' DNA nuclease